VFCSIAKEIVSTSTSVVPSDLSEMSALYCCHLFNLKFSGALFYRSSVQSVSSELK